MTSIPSRREPFVGCDVSKDTVQVHDLLTAQAWSVPNTLKSLLKVLKPLRERTLVVCEATGGYEDALLTALSMLAIPAHRGDAAKIKHFARSYVRAKTDAIDAHILALYGAERNDSLARWTPPPRELDQLNILIARRMDLVDMRRRELTRAKGPRAKACAASYKRMLEAIKAEIEEIERQIKELVAQSPQLEDRRRILRTLEGVGDTTAVTLLALLPQLGSLTRRQAASLAGVAPHPNRSGTIRGRDRTSGGRRALRPVLFVAALAAVRGSNRFAEFYKRLTAAGKTKRCALVAVMRKLIVIANARLAEIHNPPKTPQNRLHQLT